MDFLSGKTLAEAARIFTWSRAIGQRPIGGGGAKVAAGRV
jgi:hypothetical protein